MYCALRVIQPNWIRLCWKNLPLWSKCCGPSQSGGGPVAALNVAQINGDGCRESRSENYHRDHQARNAEHVPFNEDRRNTHRGKEYDERDGHNDAKNFDERNRRRLLSCRWRGRAFRKELSESPILPEHSAHSLGCICPILLHIFAASTIVLR